MASVLKTHQSIRYLVPHMWAHGYRIALDVAIARWSFLVKLNERLTYAELSIRVAAYSTHSQTAEDSYLFHLASVCTAELETEGRQLFCALRHTANLYRQGNYAPGETQGHFLGESKPMEVFAEDAQSI